MKMRSELSRREFAETLADDVVSALKGMIEQNVSTLVPNKNSNVTCESNSRKCSKDESIKNSKAAPMFTDQCWPSIGKLADFEIGSIRPAEVEWNESLLKLAICSNEDGLQAKRFPFQQSSNPDFIAIRVNLFGNVEVNPEINWPENRVFSILCNESIERDEDHGRK